MRVLDSHLHLWDPARFDYGWLEGRLLRPFGSAEVRAALQDVRAASLGFVFVQAECLPSQSLAEVDWVVGLSESLPIRGIVARATLEDPEVTEAELAALASRPLVVGVRRLLQSEPDGFCLTPAFLDSARRVAAASLTFDACVRWHQLGDVAALADAVPDLTIVLDHLGKPSVGSPADPAPARDTLWAAALGDLARRPNVVCKLSGLPTESTPQWTGPQLRPFLDVALDEFGAGRLLFGSDWPVSVPYSRWLATVQSWLDDRVGPQERDTVLAGAAERIYRLA